MFSKYAPVALLALTFGFTSCDKDDNETPTLRTKMDTAALTAGSNYLESFKDASGKSTVSLNMGNTHLEMFAELNSYMGSVATAALPSPVLDAAKLRGMYTGSNFTASALNGTNLQLRNATAASQPANSATVRTFIDGQLTALAELSKANTQTASAGQKGHLGRFLVDENGYEVNQIIQKSLLGAVQLDQVANVLLSERALGSDNTQLLSGKNYTELEHTWDMAYGTLTASPVMVLTVAPPAGVARERLLAGYVNEKNPTASDKMYLAFLRGRAAIVNNDKNAVKENATIIRTELEKTIALSAISYLEAWKSKPDMADKAHALAEGLGFIYSLRFCTLYKADAAFSDGVLNGVMPKNGGFWSLTPAQADDAIKAIKTKFSIQ